MKINPDRECILEDYVQTLERNLGTPSFDATFAVLKQSLNKADVAEIASRFVSKGGKSLSKRENLDRIYNRHASLIDSANKREWQRGKGAA